MDSWAAIVTLPGQEFLACQEIRRFCLTCFLPQRRRRIFPKGAAEPLMYAMPFIPRRVLMPLGQARDRAVHYTRGIRGPEYLVKDGEGRPWSVEAAAVRELSSFDREGAFDDPPPGNAVRLTGCELLAAVAGEALANLFAPLFVAPAPRGPTKAELERELLEAGRPAPSVSVSPWVDVTQIRAALAKDVLERYERGCDDRPSWERSADATQARASVMAAQRLRGGRGFGSFARTKAPRDFATI
jgi:hypothetical protein